MYEHAPSRPTTLHVDCLRERCSRHFCLVPECDKKKYATRANATRAKRKYATRALATRMLRDPWYARHRSFQMPMDVFQRLHSGSEAPLAPPVRLLNCGVLVQLRPGQLNFFDQTGIFWCSVDLARLAAGVAISVTTSATDPIALS